MECEFEKSIEILNYAVSVAKELMSSRTTLVPENPMVTTRPDARLTTSLASESRPARLANLISIISLYVFLRWSARKNLNFRRRSLSVTMQLR